MLGWGLVALLATAVACRASDKRGSVSVGSAEGAPYDGGPFANVAAPDNNAPSYLDASSCGGSTISASTRKVNLLLVVDASGSMDGIPVGYDQSKWQTLSSALGTALARVKNTMSLGLELFPGTDVTGSATSSQCDLPADSAIPVPVDVGSRSLPKIVAALTANRPGGGTPTAAALQLALGYFVSGPGSKLDGDSYVLLATDGGPNCNSALTCTAASCTFNLDGTCKPSGASNCCDPKQTGVATAPTGCLDDVATKAAIDALRGAGIKTFVLGIPGSEAYRAPLDMFAVAGGEESAIAPHKYFAVSANGGIGGLNTVLYSITKELITVCSLQLTSAPPDPQQLNVKVDGKVVAQSGADGWALDTQTDPPTIVLQGATCDAVQSKGAQSVAIIYGCPTVVIP